MSFIFEQILYGVILPALMMGLVLWVGGRARVGQSGESAEADESDKARMRRWAPPLGFGLAFGAAYLALVGMPQLLPTNAMHWLFYMALVAAGVGVIEAYTYKKEALRLALRIILALVTFRLALGFMVAQHWENPWLWLGALTLGSSAIMNVLDRAAEARPGAMLPVVMVLLGAGAAAILMLTGNARIAQMMGALSAAAAAALLIAWRRPELRLSRGAASVFGFLFSALLAYGYFTSADIPAFNDALAHPQTLATLLVAAAPLMLWISGQYPIKRMAPTRALLASAALVAIPLGAAVIVAANPGAPAAAQSEHPDAEFDYEAAFEEAAAKEAAAE